MKELKALINAVEKCLPNAYPMNFNYSDFKFPPPPPKGKGRNKGKKHWERSNK